MSKFKSGVCLASSIMMASIALPTFAETGVADLLRSGTNQTLANISQINSVAELSDVDPNSWAFQALKSLVERYGCIEGYPSKKYLGNRPLSRYEFAAGLNACLEKVSEQIAAATSNLATKDDLAAVQRLQEEFKTELATLRGRVDALEAKTKELEAQQFSTTVKLDGSVVMAIQGGGASGDVVQGSATGAVPGGAVTPGGSANTTFISRTSLNLRTSFTDKDELLVRLRGVTGQEATSSFPGIVPGVADSLGTLLYAGAFDGSTPNVATNGNAAVSFDKIRYVTPLFGDNFRVFIGPRIEHFEIIDTNSFANEEEEDFSSGFFVNNPLIIALFAGPGTGFDWKISDQFSLRAAYITDGGGSSIGSGFRGLTGSNTNGSVEFEFRPSETAKIKLQYSAYTLQADANATPNKTDAFGVNAEWAITPSVGIFGRYGVGTQKLFNGEPDNNLTTWQLGFAFPELFAPGNTLAIAAGQPIRATNKANGSETDFELYYSFRLNDRITLTPDLQIISQPGNVAGNSTLILGALRAVFKF
jgi:Carbohydrate-selective porin, OprB family/S-layer homology domain